MRVQHRLCAAAGSAALIAALAAWGAALAASPAPTASTAYTQAQVDRWMGQVSNWGRWGKDDQKGTLNLITPKKRVQAMALAKKGIVVSLQRKVQFVRDPEQNDEIPKGVVFYDVHFRTMPPGDPHHNEGFSGEIQHYNPHGTYTHVDAVCHDSDGKGRLYNGYDLKTSVSPEKGCLKLGLDQWPAGLVTRGVLIDMTRLKRPHTPGAPVTVADIEAFEQQAHMRVEPGDALFVYNPGPPRNGAPTRGGFDLSVAPWMKARGVALTSGFHSIPGGEYGGQVPGIQSADHRIVLAAMGMPLLDGPNLAPLAEEAARQNQWFFMLVVAPVVVPGGTGQMVNPLAMY